MYPYHGQRGEGGALSAVEFKFQIHEVLGKLERLERWLHIPRTGL